MSERALSISHSLIPLFVLVGMYAVGLSFLAARGLGASDKVELLWRVEVNLILALWVRADRQVRRFSVPFEFDAFVFFAWPLMVPYYLYRTRGIRGIFFGTGIIVFCSAPYLAAEVVGITLSGRG